MGLIKKIFGDKTGRDTVTPSSQFRDSENSAEQQEHRNATRREMVQVVLRDTMRRHGIPSDWMECRVLSVVGQGSRSGLHVTLVVRQGHARLLTYVPAFQSSYLQAVEKFDPKSAGWLLGLSWQFEGMSGHTPMPEPGAWSGAAPVAAAASAATAEAAAKETSLDNELEEDLRALYAIRDAAITQDPGRPPAGHTDFEHTQPSN